MDNQPEQPSWACRWWGSYDHDWLDCPVCIEAYEEWLESHPEDEDPFYIDHGGEG